MQDDYGLDALKEFVAADGLEIAMGFKNYNQIQQYWSTEDFYGCRTFQETMGRTQFHEIRSHRRTHPSSATNDASSTNQNDPWWFAHSLLRIFRKAAMSVASVTGALTLDEMGIPSRGKWGAISYMKSKPQKYSARLYGIVGWGYTYVVSMFQNST